MGAGLTCASGLVRLKPWSIVIRKLVAAISTRGFGTWTRALPPNNKWVQTQSWKSGYGIHNWIFLIMPPSGSEPQADRRGSNSEARDDLWPLQQLLPNILVYQETVTVRWDATRCNMARYDLCFGSWSMKHLVGVCLCKANAKWVALYCACIGWSHWGEE